MPDGLWAYIRRETGRDQLWLSVLTILVFLLTLAPLELQRRVVNDAIGSRQLPPILLLCLAYVAVVLLQGGLKLWLNIDRARVSEAATRHLRLLAQRLCGEPDLPNSAGSGTHDGVKISVIVAEVDPVGGFIGLSVSEPLLHGGILLSVFGYMLLLQPMMALVCLGVFLPQLVFVPMMQRTINRRTKSRIKVLREVSVGLVDNSNAPSAEAQDRARTETGDAYERRADRIYHLDMHIFKLKFTMNFLMNSMQHLAVAAILFVGGWFVVEGHTEVGTVVAFISGLDRVNDPWGDLVNYFREMSSARVKYRLVVKALGDAGMDALPERAA